MGGGAPCKCLVPGTLDAETSETSEPESVLRIGALGEGVLVGLEGSSDAALSLGVATGEGFDSCMSSSVECGLAFVRIILDNVFDHLTKLLKAESLSPSPPPELLGESLVEPDKPVLISFFKLNSEPCGWF